MHGMLLIYYELSAPTELHFKSEQRLVFFFSFFLDQNRQQMWVKENKVKDWWRWGRTRVEVRSLPESHVPEVFTHAAELTSTSFDFFFSFLKKPKLGSVSKPNMLI